MTEQAVTDAPTMDPTEAHHQASRYMKRIRSLLTGKAVVDGSYKEQIGEIDAWHRQETERFDSELTRLRMEMQPLVRLLVASEPTGKKSVNLVAGVAGFRAGRERVVVEDEGAALEHLGQSYPGVECIRRPKPQVDLPSVKRLFPQPEVIPGISVEKGEETFYTDPIGEPSR